jgi:hypothetical protein
MNKCVYMHTLESNFTVNQQLDLIPSEKRLPCSKELVLKRKRNQLLHPSPNTCHTLIHFYTKERQAFDDGGNADNGDKELDYTHKLPNSCKTHKDPLLSLKEPGHKTPASRQVGRGIYNL